MATATATTTRRNATAAKPKATPKPRTAAKPKPKATPKTAPVTVPALLDMSQHELDALFKAGSLTAVPSGEGKGTVIVATGTPLTALLAPLFHLAWQGKVIDGTAGTLKNRILPLGIPLIAAKIVGSDDSRLDGKPTAVLDYSKTSLVARAIRDEIREVAPGLFLGVVYVYGIKTINFSLQF